MLHFQIISKREALALLVRNGCNDAPNYLNGETYTTGNGESRVGGKTFLYSRGFVLSTTMSVPRPVSGREFQIVAFHGTCFENLSSILQNGLQVGNPHDCATFSGAVYGSGVYVSPRQAYAKLYARGDPQFFGNGRIRLVLGLRIRNAESITETTSSDIWVIKRAEDVKVQGINLTYD